VGLAGTLLLALATLGMGGVRTLSQLTLVYGVTFALGLAATGHVVASAVLSRWFIRRPATALSFLGGASMAGMSALVPAGMWLLLTAGWRAAYVVLGLTLLVVITPLLLWVVRETPEEMGLAPDGLPPAARAGGDAAAERTGIMTALQAAPFWQ